MKLVLRENPGADWLPRPLRSEILDHLPQVAVRRDGIDDASQAAFVPLAPMKPVARVTLTGQQHGVGQEGPGHEARNRIFSRVLFLHPERPDTQDWIDTLAGYAKNLPIECEHLDGEELASTIYPSTFGMQRQLAS